MLAALPRAAAVALFVYTEAALDLRSESGFADEAVVSLVVQAVISAGGRWSDVEALCALEEPALAPLNVWHARTAWRVHTADRYRLQQAQLTWSRDDALLEVAA